MTVPFGGGSLKLPKLPTVSSLTRGDGDPGWMSPKPPTAVAPPWPSGANSAQVAKNTTAFPNTALGGGPTSTPWTPAGAPPAAPVDATPDPGAPPAPPFDWYGAINGDPLYQQLQTNLWGLGGSAGNIVGGSVGVAADQRKAQSDQAFSQFGDPNLFDASDPNLQKSIQGLGLDPSSSMYQMLFGDIDQNTKDNAAALTSSGLSTLAGLDHTHQTDIQSLLDSMAAHGTVDSGATRAGNDQAQQTYLGNQYSARNTLLQYLTGVQSAFNQTYQAAQQTQAQGAQDAGTRQLALNAPTIGAVA